MAVELIKEEGMGSRDVIGEKKASKQLTWKLHRKILESNVEAANVIRCNREGTALWDEIEENFDKDYKLVFQASLAQVRNTKEKKQEQ